MREVLSCIMNRMNLTSTKLADALGINDSTVRHWLNEKNPRKPSPNAFSALCNYLSKELTKRENKSVCELLFSELMDHLLDDEEGIRLMRASNSDEAFIINSLRIRYQSDSFDNLMDAIPSSGRTRAVIFDFDGTLTAKEDEDYTTWEKLWIALGYTQDDCEKYHEQYMNKEITHKRWGHITCEHFKERKMNVKLLDKLADEITLMKNVDQLFEELENHDISVYIVSGSINRIIKRVLKRYKIHVDEIFANIMEFDKDGYLTNIIPTKYDFIGKAKYVLKISTENRISPEDILFVGNSDNDVYVWRSGADTLCLNPQLTDPYNKKIWHHYLKKCNNALKILEFVKLD